MDSKIQKLQEALKGVKLTDPQKVIANKLLDGFQLITVNAHRRSGGEMMWIKGEDLNTIQYAGSVYKAFFNLTRQLKKSGFNAGDFQSKQLNVKY